MEIFSSETFKNFLGQPHQIVHAWGNEQRYFVSEASLIRHQQLLKNTTYHHHSSFDFADEVSEVGFPLVAQAMRNRNSGNPENPTTQVGNLGEVLGKEFAKAFLGFDENIFFPKRFNPNTDQSMKGIDVFGMKAATKPAAILLGEVKSARKVNVTKLADDYTKLLNFSIADLPKATHFLIELFRLQGDQNGIANVQRHMNLTVGRSHLLLSVSQENHNNPFGFIDADYKSAPLINLLAVHIQIENLKSPDVHNSDKNWLSTLFGD